MSEQSLDTNIEATDPQTENQASAAKTYTQEEFDRHMAGLKASITKKFERQLQDLGDLDELRELKRSAESKRIEEATKRGEFEKVLQELAAKKDEEISRRDRVIEQFKLEQPLINHASEFRSVNPDQVRSLLRNQVRLNPDGEVEVVDLKGQTRYNDSGRAIEVRDLVKEFLDANPHFVQPTVSTSTGSHSIRADSSKIDPTKLDMKNPEHRKLYAELRKQRP